MCGLAILFAAALAVGPFSFPAAVLASDIRQDPISISTSGCAIHGGTGFESDCCVRRVGDANGSGADVPTVGDVAALIDAKFITGICDGILGCLTEADINQSGGKNPGCDDITIGDISMLIDYLFITGPQLWLPACPAGTVTDVDGNVYLTVKIGRQEWMAENLKVTRYRNGDAIPNVSDDGDWTGAASGAYCDYGNDPGNVDTYGRLYNWYAVNDARALAPAGWHVPSDGEWKQLELYLGMSQPQADAVGLRGTGEGGMLKETGTSHWISPNSGATNETGFSALPGGHRRYGGVFTTLGSYAVFWSSTEEGDDAAWYRLLHNDRSGVTRYANNPEYFGFSIRCVRDTGTVTDIDGNVYRTVMIGDQEWMAENLKVTHYRNGDAIPNVSDDGAWVGMTSGAYCEYGNSPAIVDTYGRLYNWYAVEDARGLAPAGWHVPSDAEWKQLEIYLGMSQADADDIELRGTGEGGKLKETGTVHWNAPNSGATDQVGFTALPGGHRRDAGYYTTLGYYAVFWTSTEDAGSRAWYRLLFADNAGITRLANNPSHYGFSIRCVRD